MKVKNGQFLLLGLLALLSGQFLLFYFFSFHEIVDVYPSNYDQASYLTLVYTLFEKINQEGLSALANPSYILPTGLLFPLQTLLVFKLFGASRFSAILPNFIYFAVLQITVFWAAKKQFGHAAYGFIFVGLILTLNTPFYIGGLTDFRMDFIAFCLYGIGCTLAIRSHIFLERNASIGFALFTAFMIYFRFITGLYFFLTALGLIIYFSAQYFTSRALLHKLEAKKRLIHFFIVLFIVSILILPSLIYTQDALYQYYVIAHTASNELPFRNVPPGTSILAFYPKIIRKIHFGNIGQKAVQFLAAFYLVVYLFFKIKAEISQTYCTKKKMRFAINELFFLSLAILCPLILLTLDPTKSYVVGGIVNIPLLWMVIFFCFYMQTTLARYAGQRLQNHILTLLAVVVLSLGIYQQWHATAQQLINFSKEDHPRRVTKLYEDIGNYAEQNHWPSVHLSIDYVTDYLNHGSFITLYYEKRAKLLTIFTERLGSDLFSPITAEEALDSLKKSNVIILTIGNYPKNAFFPGSQSVQPFRSQLIQYADSHFRKLGDYDLLGYQRRVYVSK